MKKKIVFDLPTDVVGIRELDLSKGIVVAEKEGYQAILSDRGLWLSTDGFSPVTHLTGGNRLGSITLAKEAGATIYHYDSFYEFCEEEVKANE